MKKYLFAFLIAMMAFMSIAPSALAQLSSKDQSSVDAIAKELGISQDKATTVLLYLKAGQPVTMNGKTLTPDFIKGKTNQPEQEEQIVETIPFQLVEQKPSFNGGDANEFSKWVNSKIVYPETAKENKREGRVTLQFLVGADGNVKNVRVIRGLDPDLDKEAVRVVSSSPKWVPGRHRGQPVNVSYTFPVVFSLTPPSSQQNKTSTVTSTSEATETANEYAWLVGTWSVNTPEFGSISLRISGNGQTGRLNFDGENGSYEVKGSEIRCHIDGDPKDLITVFQIHSGHRIYFGSGYYFNKVSYAKRNNEIASMSDDFSSTEDRQLTSSEANKVYTFNSPMDVFDFLHSRVFKSSDGVTLDISPSGVKVNGRPITAAVQVTYIQRQQAIMKATSPLTNHTYTFIAYADKNCIVCDDDHTMYFGKK